VGVGDTVIVTTSDFRSTPMGAIATQKRFIVSGIFEAGYNEFDKGLAVVSMKDLQRVLRMGEGVTGVRLKLHDMDKAFDVARDLALELGGPYSVSDWSSENANLFRALKMEKTIMAILLASSSDGRVQPGQFAGDAGDRQAGRHRHPAHPRPDATRGYEGIHGAGHADRRDRNDHRRDRRHPADAQPRHILRGSNRCSACS
jgi:hypothetical protein